MTPDPNVWLLPGFVAGCALIHLTQRWATEVTVVLTGVFMLVLVLFLIASNPDGTGQAAAGDRPVAASRISGP